jgi:hypothetical protein
MAHLLPGHVMKKGAIREMMERKWERLSAMSARSCLTNMRNFGKWKREGGNQEYGISPRLDVAGNCEYVMAINSSQQPSMVLFPTASAAEAARAPVGHRDASRAKPERRHRIARGEGHEGGWGGAEGDWGGGG